MFTARAARRTPFATATAALLTVVAVGLGLRLYGLDHRTLTHAEVYVPRLEMPEYVSAPPPRTTLSETVLGTLHHDNHPPGYYALMWAWTGLFGTGLIALRLPSALAGAATIALLYWTVRREDGESVALTAAALLAFHGHHLFWSQQARMWVLLASAAVLSVLLLQSLHQRYRGTTAAAYVFVVSLGLWLEYSFWPFFAAQIAWEVCRSCEAKRMPAALDLQLLSLVLSSPLLVFLQVHVAMGRTGYLAGAGVLDHLTGFLLLQWLVRSPAPPERFGPVTSIAVLALLAAATALLIAGIATARARAAPTEAAAGPPAIPLAAWIAAAVLPTLFTLWCVARGERGAVFLVGIALPWLLLALGRGAAAAWPVGSRPIRKLRSRAWVRRLTDDAAVVHVVVPVAILLLASRIVPSVAARSLLFATPFALWLVARGLAVLLPRPALRVAGTALLLLASGISVRQYTSGWVSLHDYQDLASQMRPLLGPRDVILINDAWWAQPMHYYLPPGRFQTGDFNAHVRGLAPDARSKRIWVVLFNDQDVTAFEALAPRLRGYRKGRRLAASGASAVLLQYAAATPATPRGAP